jgi:hypothetical protein
LEEEADDEEGNEICVAEWVEKPGDKPISCSFLKPNGGRRDEMRYTFDVTKCDRLIDLLLWGGVIRLTEGHVIPNADILAKKAYCKLHASYTHTTNNCIYFWRQVQSVINNGRLTLGHGGKMKLDTDPFHIGMVDLMDKKGFVCTDQAEMSKGKNVVVSDELRNWMIKPHNPEIGMLKENMLWKPAKRVKPTSAMLIEKYLLQLEEDRWYRVTRGIKWDRFFEARNQLDQQEPRCIEESWKRWAQPSIDQAPKVRQNAWVTDRLGSGNPDHCNCPNVLCKEEEPSREQEQVKKNVVMVGSWPCMMSSVVHING